jgi:opacity protein-like surface antigen
MRHVTFAAALTALISVAPSDASAQQSLSLSIGGFVPRGEDTRGRDDRRRSDDVLVNNLDFLVFDIKDFNGFTAQAEYLVGIGEWLDAGVGVGVYRKTVPTIYADLVNSNGAEIEQNLRLRIVPFTATVRFLPVGRGNGIEPYIGAGVAFLNWRYSESGSFVDFTDFSIFRDSFTGSGTAAGPLVLGGIRFGPQAWGIGVEVRHQSALGTLPIDQGFAGDRIDLGGFSYLTNVTIRF